MIGVIYIDVFNIQVAVYAKDKDRRKELRKKGFNADNHDEACLASAHMDMGPDGRAWFSMVIKPEATRATWAHECVHIADFLMERVGIPSSTENTEVRAYLVGHIFARLDEMMGA